VSSAYREGVCQSGPEEQRILILRSRRQAVGAVLLNQGPQERSSRVTLNR
jgi:hypothetical protein